RHATTERAEPRVRRVPDAGTLDERLRTAGPGPFTDAAGGAGFLTALRTGNAPRAAWQPVPAAGPGWADGFALAAAATLAAGKGTLCVAPDVTDLAHLETACTALVGPDAVLTLISDMGPAARYRAFLAAVRGHARIVLGTRAAAFAPVADLGLVALWDDGDDLLAEPRAPYPHAREVLAMRASREG